MDQQKKSKRKKTKKYIKNMSLFSIALMSGLFTLIISFIFMVVYWTGEQLGVAPVITLGTLDWLTYGEGIIIYVVLLSSSVFFGSFIILYWLRKYG